jgi:3-hydroxyacyl-[acyl-carrier-protein] dehydratase
MRNFTLEDEVQLRRALKRCPGSTREAAREFRKTGDPRHVPAIIRGLVEQQMEPDLCERLGRPDDQLLLREHLGIDSLAMMEMMILVEDVLQVSINNGDLHELRTVADLNRFIASRVQAGGWTEPDRAAVKEEKLSAGIALPGEQR